MAKKPRPTTLSGEEKSIIKALLIAGERNQDIQALVNTGRVATINSGRITGIKKDNSIIPATNSQLSFYKLKKQKFDPTTGLCAFDDERLVRAREAMILAVELFNTPRIYFKAGVFSMLVNVAWTYLFHEYYNRKGVNIINNDGHSLLLSQMIARKDCPIPTPVRKNLLAIKEIRDTVEHLTIEAFDNKWSSLFQANCLNFEKYLVEWFGAKLSLQNELGLALQFSRLTMGTSATIQQYGLTPHIAALDARLTSSVTEEEAADLQYQFKVVYSLQSATKSTSHFQFIEPGSEENLEIANVLLKYKPADELYPFKPRIVCNLVSAASKRKFTTDKHRKAWALYKVRPTRLAADKASTNRDYCLYHAAHKDYTYSQKWVDFLLNEIQDDTKWLNICNYKAQQ